MRIISPTKVHLEKGDVVPVFCPCGEIYTPPKDSTQSRCPKCSRLNFHDDNLVEPELKH